MPVVPGLTCQNSGLCCGSDALPEVDLDPIARNFDGPEQASRWASGGMQVVELYARNCSGGLIG